MHQLTQREIEIVNLVTSGFNNQEIAKKLCISASATKSYVSEIYRKLSEKLKKTNIE